MSIPKRIVPKSEFSTGRTPNEQLEEEVNDMASKMASKLEQCTRDTSRTKKRDAAIDVNEPAEPRTATVVGEEEEEEDMILWASARNSGYGE